MKGGGGVKVVMLLVFSVLAVAQQDFLEAEAEALRSFQRSADAGGKLNWSQAGNPCGGEESWNGVYCQRGRVYKLFLSNLGLQGPITALAAVGELRVLSLGGNQLQGSLPDLGKTWPLLRQLYLDGNQLGGPIPDSVGNLTMLWRLFLGGNRLNGSIPASLSNVKRLLTLRLESNLLSSTIPDLDLANLTDLDLSGNQLQGQVPVSLRRFGAKAFEGNAALCGPPLGVGCVEKRKGGKLGKGAIVGIVVADILVVAMVTLLFLWYYWRRYSRSFAEAGPVQVGKSEKGDVSSSHYSLQLPESERSKLVFFDAYDTSFELEELLRASAEMLGKGSFGTAYKAVLEDGTVVAVKRLKDVTSTGRRDFEQQMDVIGRLRHENLLPLLAYYYAKDEKLLVYPYHSNGSLYALLHGSRGPGRTPLDWVSRLKIAAGTARGLAYLHQESKVAHANIKSSNVLLDVHYNPCVADYGMALLVSPSMVAARTAGYRAPEQGDAKKQKQQEAVISQRADVYSFGVLLLELLTGKAPTQSYLQDEGIDLPRWVQSVVREEWTAEVFDIELMRYKNIEEEMVSLLQIAMLCVSQAPDQRPKMSQVVSMIQDVQGVPDSPSPADHSLSSAGEEAASSQN